jgi:hypothetical protein
MSDRKNQIRELNKSLYCATCREINGPNHKCPPVWECKAGTKAREGTAFYATDAKEAAKKFARLHYFYADDGEFSICVRKKGTKTWHRVTVNKETRTVYE